MKSIIKSLFLVVGSIMFFSGSSMAYSSSTTSVRKPEISSECDTGNFLMYGTIAEIDPDPFDVDPIWSVYNDRLEADIYMMQKIGIDAVGPNGNWMDRKQKLGGRFWTKWVEITNQWGCPWLVMWQNPYTKMEMRNWPKPGTDFRGTYGNKERYAQQKKNLKDIISAGDDHIVKYKGRYVLNFGKENAYTTGNRHWRCAAHPCDVKLFVADLKKEFNDKAPNMDSNEDKKTFNEVFHENYSSWEELESDTFYFEENRFKHPYLFWCFVHWADDMIWSEYYNKLMEELNAWKLANMQCPFRHHDQVAFVHAGLVFDKLPLGTRAVADYWTRNFPEKGMLMHSSQGLGNWTTEKIMKYMNWRDIQMAEVFGATSRINSFYMLDFDGEAPGSRYYNTLLTCWKHYPNNIRAVSWWIAFFEEQNWILKDMLTVKPEIAVLHYDDEIRLLGGQRGPHGSPHIRFPAIPDGYGVHSLDCKAILDDKLKNYHILFVGATRLPENVLDNIVEFKNNGGYVVGIFCGTMFNIFGKRTEHFKKLFGCEPTGFFQSNAHIPKHKEFDSADPIGKKFSLLPENAGGNYSFKDIKGHAARFIALSDDNTSKKIGYLKKDNIPIAAVSNDGHGIFLGAQDAQNSKIINEILKMAGIKRPLQATCKGKDITSYLKVNKYNDSAMIILRNPFDTPEVHVSIPGFDSYNVWDIRTEKEIGKIENDSIICHIPQNEPVILFLTKNQALADKFIKIQRQVNLKANDIIPFDGGNIHFFVKCDALGLEPYIMGKKVNKDQLERVKAKGKEIRKISVWDNAVIVVGERVSEKGKEFAVALRKVFYNYRQGDERIILPILSPEQAEKMIDKKNILLIGEASKNSLSKKLLSDGDYGLDEDKPVSGRQKRSWYDGGNVNMIVDKEENYKNFYDWIRISSGSYDTYYNPIFAPWDGYSMNFAADMHKGWSYEPRSYDVWKVEGDKLIINAPAFKADKKLPTAQAKCCDVNWCVMETSLTLMVEKKDTLFGIGIGEYTLLVCNDTWQLFKLPNGPEEKWAITKIDWNKAEKLDEGTFSFSTNMWYKISCKLDDKTFSFNINDKEIVKKNINPVWHERKLNIYAANGIIKIRNLRIQTRPLDNAEIF